MAAAGLGLAALALAGLAGGARADGHCGNATMASVAQSVPDLSALVGVVTSVSEDASQAKTAEPFLEAIQDPSTANVTAFAPVNSAFEELANATFNAAEVLMFHAVAEAMEEGEGYDTLAGAAAGQLTINGDEVEGPCNTAKVLQSVDVCESVVHVVDKVLLPAEFCAGASEEESNDDSAEDGGEPSEDDAGDDEDDSGNDGGEESEDDAGDDEDASGNDGGEESEDDAGDDEDDSGNDGGEESE